MIKKITMIVVAAVLAVSFGSAVQANTMMKHTMTPMHSTMHKMGAKTVYYCKKCNMYYSAADAKKMHMKDPMGHQLMAMKMDKVPKSAKMGTMSKKDMMSKKHM